MNEVVKSGDWQEQIALVKSMVAKGATDNEFALMSHIAIKYELDPLLKQIWVVKYGDAPASIFTGRDGFLSIAHRTGQFNGIETVVEKVNEPIKVVKKRWKDKKQIEIVVERAWQYKAVCTVRRKDAEFPFIVEVYEEEYTTCENLWVSKPRTMLGKVAESQCLRKAFDIAGLYSPEEMPEPHEKELNPVADAQKEFEKKKGIVSEPAETEPEPGQPPPETPEAKAKRELGERQKSRLEKCPQEFRDYCKSAKLPLKKVFEIMDANQDDQEALLAFAVENMPQPTMPAQGEEGLPG